MTRRCALIAGQNMVLIGPPGMAIVEGIANAIRTRKNGTIYFVPAKEKGTLLAFS